MIKYIIENIKAFWITIGYVGFSLISICSFYPTDKFYGEWVWIGTLITFPINFISLGFRYTTSEIIYPVFIIQGFVFIPTFVIIASIIRKRKQKKFKLVN